MDIYEILFRTIQQALKENKMTEKECLSNSGVNKSFFSDWRSGRSKRQSFDNIYRICRYLNISIDSLEGNQPFLSGNPERQIKEDPDELRVIGKYRKLDEDGKDAVKGVLLAEERRVESIGEEKKQKASG